MYFHIYIYIYKYARAGLRSKAGEARLRSQLRARVYVNIYIWKYIERALLKFKFLSIFSASNCGVMDKVVNSWSEGTGVESTLGIFLFFNLVFFYKLLKYSTIMNLLDHIIASYNA